MCAPEDSLSLAIHECALLQQPQCGLPQRQNPFDAACCAACPVPCTTHDSVQQWARAKVNTRQSSTHQQPPDQYTTHKALRHPAETPMFYQQNGYTTTVHCVQQFNCTGGGPSRYLHGQLDKLSTPCFRFMLHLLQAPWGATVLYHSSLAGLLSPVSQCGVEGKQASPL